MLFIFYLLLCATLIIKLKFFKNSGLTPQWLCLFFVVKILAGVAFGLFYKQPRYFATADTWRFYKQSLIEKDWLLHNPVQFGKDLFTYGYSNSGNVFSGNNSYWNDLKSNLIIKLLAVCNVLTNNSYFTNIILFNFLFLFGLVALLRVAQQELTLPKWVLILAIFFIPGTLFWCSGIHKDGLILSATGLAIFWFYKIITSTTIHLKWVSGLFLSICLVLVFRSYVALALLPAMFSWWLTMRLKRNLLLVFGSVYFVGIALFFCSPFISSAVNFPEFLATKQHEFLLLSGGSALPVKSLEGNLTSFLKYMPTALDIAFLRPHVYEAKNVATLSALFELWMIGLLIIMAFIFPLKKQSNPFTFFLLFFGLSLLIIAGYTVTLTGALVRYRSFVLPFIVLPILTFINFKATRLPFNLFVNKG